jgi:hypothetical protein
MAHRPIAVCSIAPRMSMETTLSVCAEGHAGSYLGGAASYSIGGDAVEAECCQEQGQDAEEGHEPGDHAVLAEAVADLLVEGLKLHDGEVRIDGGEGLASDRLRVVHGPVGPEDDDSDIEACILLYGALAYGGWYAPCQGDET